ncbi:MAG: NAD(P)-dependent oxidoreductase, partial [Myxococcota bacterium]|nr:NAD(P)-dependent oxidoreductase [Myxococcota bacterium]
MSETGVDPLKRVAVTGASGFVGTALVHRLAEAGVTVVGTDRYAPETPLPVESFVVADIGDEDALAGVVAGTDVVFHLGAVASIARAPRGLYQRVNVQGTDGLLACARAAGARRVVHVSSSTVYGVPDENPIREDRALAPACPYSRSKAEAEAMCARHAAEGMEVAIIRPRVVVGPGRAGIFALLFTFLRKGLPIPLPGGASNQFQLTAVDDLAEACILAAEPGVNVDGARVFNIGSEVNRPLRGDLEELIAHAQSPSRLIPVPAWPATTSLSLLHTL